VVPQGEVTIKEMISYPPHPSLAAGTCQCVCSFDKIRAS